MNREIKFRAWDKQARQFLLWEFLKTKLCNFFEIDWLDCQQFTGLKDKNGKEIYEGDILKTDCGNFYIKECLPFIELLNSNNFSYNNGDYYLGGDVECHDWSSFEVIGNICENPELLEEV